MKRSSYLIVALMMSALFGLDTRTLRGQSPLDSIWVRGDYLLWQTTGMKLPPLVTASPPGTAADEVGVIGFDDTAILVGNETILEGTSSGLRFSAGADLCCRFGVEADYFKLQDDNQFYSYGPSNRLLIARPYIDLESTPLEWDSELVNFPPIVDGQVNVHAYSNFQGAGALFRVKVFAAETCSGGGIGGCCDGMAACQPTVFRHSRFDLTLGYRYLKLDEGVSISERLVSQIADFDVDDSFDTSSTFNGIEFGADYAYTRGILGFNLFSRLGVGGNNNRIQIAGQTAIDGILEQDPGGLLAQASNIGSRSHLAAALMAQLGCNLNVCLTDCAYAHIGYSFLYWGDVVRAGEQIDLRVNPGLLPPFNVAPNSIGALPTHKTSNFFAHGLNAGITVTL